MIDPTHGAKSQLPTMVERGDRLVVNGQSLKGHLAHGRRLVLRVPQTGDEFTIDPDEVDRQPIHSIDHIAEEYAREEVGSTYVSGAYFVLLNANGIDWSPDGSP